MENEEYWNVFEQTGSVDAYLLYACASESVQIKGSMESEPEDESGKYYGDGTFGSTSRRL